MVAEGFVICTYACIMARSRRQPGASPMTGATIWQSSSANPDRCTMVAPLWRCPSPSACFTQKFCASLAATAKWSIPVFGAVRRRTGCALRSGMGTGDTNLLNLLGRLLDGTPTDQPDVNPPAALSLGKEPEANVARYDVLHTQKGTGHAP